MQKVIAGLMAGFLVLNLTAAEETPDKKRKRPDSPYPFVEGQTARRRLNTPEPKEGLDEMLAPETPEHLQGLSCNSQNSLEKFSIPESPQGASLLIDKSNDQEYSYDSEDMFEPTQNYVGMSLEELQEHFDPSHIVFNHEKSKTKFTLKCLLKTVTSLNEGAVHIWHFGPKGKEPEAKITLDRLINKEGFFDGKILFGSQNSNSDITAIVSDCINKTITFDYQEKKFAVKTLKEMKANFDVIRNPEGNRAEVRLNS
jgi:hypothetical protein